MENVSIEDAKVSEFDSVRTKKSRIITIKEYVYSVRSDIYKKQVEEYTRLKSQNGHEAEAQKVKDSMPCIVSAGVCQGGHAVKNLTEHSSLMQIDMDRTCARTQEICCLLKQLPYVAVAHKSFSQEGIRVLVHVSRDDVKRNYEALYAAVGQAISAHTGHEYDPKCKILTQPSFYSWDPEAYFNPNATTFGMQWEESDAPAGSASPAPATTTAVSEAATPAASDPLPLPAPAAPAPGFLVQWLSDFEHRNPFIRGQRNDLALKLGRQARSKGFSIKELEALIELFARHYAAPDFTTEDIRKRVCAGYQFVEEEKQKTGNPYQGSLRGQTLTAPKSSEEEAENADEVLENNNTLRATAPFIPREVYRQLPQFLQDCVKYASPGREEDLALLGCLNSCSAALPYVSFNYNKALFSPHFYFAAIAAAGAGKGVLEYTSQLLDPINEHYEQKYRKAKKEFDKQDILWQSELHSARHAHRPPNFDLKPEEPQAEYLKIAATLSKSRLIEHMAASGGRGCYMFSSEIHTIDSSMSQECGDFSDIFCKAFQHETISMSYKNGGAPVIVPSPRLAVCLSGTQEQFHAMFRSQENGLTSRFNIYTRESEGIWKSCAPLPDGVELRDYHYLLGKKLLEMHLTLLSAPTLVTFSPAQWQLHTEHFSQLLEHALAEGKEATQAIIFRHGLLAMRLSSIFTVFRKYEDYPLAAEYRCTDEDFNIALLITDTLLEHTLLLSTSIPQTTSKPRRMHPFHRLEKILEQLKSHFTFSEFMDAAAQAEIPETTAKRLLKLAIKSKLVVKLKDSYIKKKKSTHE